MTMIDPEKLAKRLLQIADRYATERSQTKSVARTIAKAKQEAIAEAIEAVTQEIVEETKWRYFTTAIPGTIARVGNGRQGYLYWKDGSSEPTGMYLEWWNDTVKRNKKIREITEADAICLLGCKPWEDNTK